MTTFAGKWKYQSYRPEPGSVAADPAAPGFVRWSPPGVVTVDECGTAGTLVFTLPPPKPGDPPPTLTLALTIRVVGGTPAALAISATMPRPGGEAFTNELHGWFAPADLGRGEGEDHPLVVRGAIVQTSTDIIPEGRPGRQPAGTIGFFVLEPVRV